MQEKKDYQQIKGWGIDADPENEPTYPIKNYTGDDHKRLEWERPSLQQTSQEILVSTERPALSAVVGETIPPKGLSGMLRRYAFKSSEAEYSHWLPLLLADRINEWEGIIDDLRRGKLPNFFVEKGGRAAWKYNRNATLKKAAMIGSIGLVIAYFCLKRRN